MEPLDHLIRLSDSCGIWQHARHAVPDRRQGYCLDDVARGLWLCARRARLDACDPIPGQLAGVYAAFIEHAWEADAARFRNFLTHDRRWIGHEDEDASARALLSLAEAARAPLPDGIADWARDLLRETLPLAGKFRSPRPWAWALAALAAARDLDLPADALAAELAAKLLGRWQDTPGAGFEAYLAYDSPRLAQGAFDGASWEPALADAGLAALREITRMQTCPNGHFRPPGSEGYGRPGRPARFAQQPLDAWAQIEAALAALTLTGDAGWAEEARRAHCWFLGRNEAGVALVTDEGGCRDGIDPQGVSVNQGAESTLAWLHSDAAMQLAGVSPWTTLE
jgi:hypothetical protein